MELDRTSKRILVLLDRNARMSATAIGREIGLSRSAVQERIARMERDGVIQRYRVEIAPGSDIVHARLFITIAERPCDRALRWLASLEGVSSVVSMAGEVDAIAEVVVPTAADLSRLNDTISRSELISSSVSRVVLARY
jgi:Transcriptional regulators